MFHTSGRGSPVRMDEECGHWEKTVLGEDTAGTVPDTGRARREHGSACQVILETWAGTKKSGHRGWLLDGTQLTAKGF